MRNRTTTTDLSNDNAMTIRTDNKPRPIIYGYELTDKERGEFDFLEGDDLDFAQFVRYKRRYEYLGDFMRIDTQNRPTNAVEHALKQWHGYQSDSFFSGLLVRYCDDSEFVIVGWYCS